MERISVTALTGALAALALIPAAAPGSTRNLWATVNICNTNRHPYMMGVRARMPGDGTHERMFMRFTAQFRVAGEWKRVDGGRSRWLYAGSALFRSQELGYTFTFDPPPAGRSYLFRGLVQMQWRLRGRIVHRTHVYTERGHPTRSSDPRRFSAATCRISTPA